MSAQTALQKYVTVKDLLGKNEAAIAEALPRGLEAKRLIRTALIAVTRNPALLDCDQRSLASSLIEAATLGLEVDGVQGHGYLVPFNKRVTFMPGYKGLLELARRSGQVSSIDARVVYEGEVFEYAFGLEPVLRHIPGQERDPKKLVAAYAVCHLKDGGKQFEVLIKADVEMIRSRSRAGTSGPWVTDTAEMWRKTALRRLCKMLPLSAQDARAVTKAELVEAGVDPGPDFDPVTGEVPPPDGGQSALDAVVEARGEPA